MMLSVSFRCTCILLPFVLVSTVDLLFSQQFIFSEASNRSPCLVSVAQAVKKKKVGSTKGNRRQWERQRLRGGRTVGYYSRKTKMSSTTSATTAAKSISGHFIDVYREDEKFKMYYDYHVLSTSMLSSTTCPKLPVVMLHGGPGLPSDYLRPAIDLFGSSSSSDHDDGRPILLYDQVGCGLSDMPSVDSSKYYSFELLAQDLDKLIRHLFPSQKFHLYGHSCGGILAYEYLKFLHNSRSSSKVNCQSVVLSSTPSDIPMTNQAWDNLQKSIQEELEIPDDFISIVDNVFQQRHVCRRRGSQCNDGDDDSSNDSRGEGGDDVRQPPKPLQEAYDKGNKAVWSGIDARGVHDYTASNVGDKQLTINIPTIIPRGQYDFVSYKNILGWKPIFDDITYVELKDCSHHCMLEHPQSYKELLEDFWNQHDKEQQ